MIRPSPTLVPTKPPAASLADDEVPQCEPLLASSTPVRSTWFIRDASVCMYGG